MSVTRNQAICILFYADYTPENVEKYTAQINQMENCDICWTVNEREPVVVSNLRILGGATLYHRYPQDDEDLNIIEPKDPEDADTELQTYSQALIFLNHTFCTEPQNSILYEQKAITIGNVFEVVSKYTSIFDLKSAKQFSVWLRTNNADLLKVKESRKNKVRSRLISVLKEEYRDFLVESISKYLPRFQSKMKSLIEEDFVIIGYCRKSPSQETEETRLKLLQKMVKNLRSRAFAQKVFVSASSKASDPLHERDLPPAIQNKLDNVDGNTQDFLEYVYSTEENLCIVATDFTGITTRPTDIVKLLCTNKSIKKVAIETFHTSNDVWIYDSETILADNSLLERFNSRKKPVHRSTNF
ncbi:hypothetical protein INT47_000751 [Mucor saturninus]|uniref:Uncharacterized protein n=1 Tax=Mucor saturninus TaxID=64648 RepID=A0A8H7QV46_9FUNG|nr:hypothetical protein INT47_000751 [Mucor saturninus]